MPWSEAVVAAPAVLVGAALIATKVSALGTGWAILHAQRTGLFDQPGERRSHDQPTPRGGGVGIVLAALLAMLGLSVWGPYASSWGLLALGLGLVAAIGWWDDHRPLPPVPRLLVHALGAACLAGALYLQGAGLQVAGAAFVLGLVLVNAWNFMDGINGLATSQALLCASGFAVLLGDGWRVLALVVAGACLGFLPFNAPRAKVFLGDVGSGALGYLVAALLAAGLAPRETVWWPLLLLAPAAMLVDTGLTLLWRVRHGECWWEPHVQHAFQRWSRRHGHVRVCVAYALWTFAAVAIMLAAFNWPVHIALAATLAILLASAWAWRWLHRRYEKNNTEGFGT